jgi:hypothetical protein
MSNVVQVDFKKKPKALKKESFEVSDKELSDTIASIRLQIARITTLMDAYKKGVTK